MIFLTAFIGAGLTAAAFFLVKTRENERKIAEVNRQIAFQNELLDARIRSISEAFLWLGRMFQAHGNLNGTFVMLSADTVDRYREVQLIFWVTADSSPSYEASQNSQAFDFTKIIHFGVPDAPPKEHFPIYFISGRPMPGLELGTDLAQKPCFLRLLQKCLKSRELVLEESCARENGPKAIGRVALAVPVFAPAGASETAQQKSSQCKGFVIGILNEEQFAAEALKNLPRRVSTSSDCGLPTGIMGSIHCRF